MRGSGFFQECFSDFSESTFGQINKYICIYIYKAPNDPWVEGRGVMRCGIEIKNGNMLSKNGNRSCAMVNTMN